MMRRTEHLKWSKRITALTLTLLLTVSMMPTVSYAAGNVAKIGATEYATLEAAFTAATAGATITLTADVNLDAQIEIDKQVTLDLAGYTIDRGLKDKEPVFDGRIFYIEDNGNLTLNDSSQTKTGKLTGGNTDDSRGGAIYCSGILTMNGGTIEGNASDPADNDSYGGGVYVYGKSKSFTMNGGTIKDNKASFGGGVCAYDLISFTMNYGTITGNTATTYGGGIYFKNSNATGSPKATINDGSISGNSASQGGGIYVQTTALTMTGGTITGNHAIGNDGNSGFGGGIADYSGSKITGGTITGNLADSKGGGVYAGRDLYIGGTINITDNHVASDLNNVFLENYKFMLIDNEDLQQGAMIGVSVAPPLEEGSPKTIASTTIWQDDEPSTFTGYAELVQYFSSDNPAYEFDTPEIQEDYEGYIYTEYKLNLILPSPHTHEWTYMASGNTLKAICTSEEACDHHADGTPVVLTLTANDVTDQTLNDDPSLVVYSTDKATSWTESGLFEITNNNTAITYIGINGTTYNSTDKPDSMGNYRVKYTITNGADTYILSDDFVITDGMEPSGTITLPGDATEYSFVGETYNIAEENKYNDNITVNITAADNEGGSGIDTIAYYIQNIPYGEESVSALSTEQLDSVDWNNLSVTRDSVSGEYRASLTINRDERGVIYARIKDKADNVKYIATFGVCVDVFGPEFIDIEHEKRYSTDMITFSLKDASEITAVTCKKDGEDCGEPYFTNDSGACQIQAGERTDDEIYTITATDEYNHISTCTIIINKKYIDKENSNTTTGFIATEVQAEQDTPSAEVDNLSVEMVKNNILTPEEKESVEEGKEIIILLEMSKETSPDSDIEAGIIDKVREVYDEAGENCQFLYLDLELSKIIQENGIAEGSPESITDTKGAELIISLDLPKELLNTNSRINRKYFIIRSHQQEDTTYSYDLIQSTFDKSTGKLTFASGLFSIYGISYIDEPISETPSTPSDYIDFPKSENTDEKTTDEPKEKASGDISEERSREILETAKKSNFSRLQPVAKNNTKKSVTLNWKEETEADGYMIYGNLCNHDGHKYKLEYIKTVDKSKLELTLKGLTKGTYYKYQIVAFKMVDGKRVAIAKTPIVHTITKGGKYGVAKAIRIAKIGKKSYNTEENVALTLKKGKTIKVNAKEIKEDKTIQHHRNVLYVSDNKKVATVDKKGQIVAKGKGTCTIYIYAQNGVYNTITVTVP